MGDLGAGGRERRAVLGTAATSLEVRAATEGDRPAILGLLQASLGWAPDDDHARFFDWKHRQGPFGPSPAWVAVDGAGGGQVVGFRTFSRWRFLRAGRPVTAVRAVDTATHPAHQGRGIFTLLTRHALEELRSEGVAFVFNTPNERSRPGYVKMGWRLVGRLPVATTVRSPRSLVRLARARRPADKWSTASAAGVPVTDVLAEAGALAALLAAQPSDGRLRTDRSPAYLSWRYGFAPLRYRAVVAPGGVAAGVVIFRLRRRGPALELAVCEQIVPAGDDGTATDLVRRALREAAADHAVQIGRPCLRRRRLPVPGQGPTLAWRGLADGGIPTGDQWALDLGDVELF
ncbi:MAG TPA: GNAT family N-acetyltransferase [Acidimicrobiales bacterium]|nr:GNAT family N-acetyltransferase [Acidimicrobiales bacterium]